MVAIGHMRPVAELLADSQGSAVPGLGVLQSSPVTSEGPELVVGTSYMRPVLYFFKEV